MNAAIAVVLAAGKGTRMKSALPKVLVPACGRPMIEYVLDALAACGVPRVLAVIGYEAQLVRQTLSERPGLEFVEQSPQLGTGHALMVCRPQLAGHTGPVLVLTGDSPLVQADSLQTLLEEQRRTKAACILGTANKENPQGLGRIVRGAKNEFLRIVEERDATADEKRITEVNLSCYVFHGPDLLLALEKLENRNAQGEYYLTDCPGILLKLGKTVRALPVLKPVEALSVNTLEELALVEQALRDIRPGMSREGP